MNKNRITLMTAIGIGLVTIGIFSQLQNQEEKESVQIENKIESSDIDFSIDKNQNEEVNFFDQETSVDNIIKKKLEEIQEINEKYEYKVIEREWIESGPFKIDRSEYILGEKIFFTVGPLTPMEKGQIAFLNPLNSTHYNVYLTYSFDGNEKSTANLYFEPSLSKAKGICDISQLIGEWRVVFRGTDYENLEFTINEQIMPGDEEDFEPVC